MEDSEFKKVHHQHPQWREEHDAVVEVLKVMDSEIARVSERVNKRREDKRKVAKAEL